MINIKSGHIKISKQLEIGPGYTFEEFKKTKFYRGEDGVRIIYLKEPQNIEGKKYIISLFFREGTIYSVSLIYCESKFLEVDEPQRKKLHDAILVQNNIEVGKRYVWGKVNSEYDVRGNISSINIYFTD